MQHSRTHNRANVIIRVSTVRWPILLQTWLPVTNIYQLERSSSLKSKPVSIQSLPLQEEGDPVLSLCNIDLTGGRF